MTDPDNTDETAGTPAENSSPPEVNKPDTATGSLQEGPPHTAADEELGQPDAAAADVRDRAPVGWYPTPDGGQRYWDGAKWLDLPDPDGGRMSAEAAPTAASADSRRTRKLVTAAIVGVLALVLVGGGLFAWKLVSDGEAARVAAEEAAEVAREREAEAEREKEREEAAERAAEAEADAERDTRAAAVPGIEDSVKVMAEEHASDGVIDGPILSVTCSPVDGGSIDDLSELTTVFECFVATVDNGDGTMTGYTYNATMNWSTGSYTYGLGAP